RYRPHALGRARSHRHPNQTPMRLPRPGQRPRPHVRDRLPHHNERRRRHIRHLPVERPQPGATRVSARSHDHEARVVHQVQHRGSERAHSRPSRNLPKFCSSPVEASLNAPSRSTVPPPPFDPPKYAMFAIAPPPRPLSGPTSYPTAPNEYRESYVTDPSAPRKCRDPARSEFIRSLSSCASVRTIGSTSRTEASAALATSDANRYSSAAPSLTAHPRTRCCRPRAAGTTSHTTCATSPTPRTADRRGSRPTSPQSPSPG